MGGGGGGYSLKSLTLGPTIPLQSGYLSIIHLMVVVFPLVCMCSPVGLTLLVCAHNDLQELPPKNLCFNLFCKKPCHDVIIIGSIIQFFQWRKRIISDCVCAYNWWPYTELL